MHILLTAALMLSPVQGTATATPTCVDDHVQLTVTAHLPASTPYVRYTAANTGTFDLGPSVSAGTWSVWVTRRSGRAAESYLLQARYAATECAL